MQFESAYYVLMAGPLAAVALPAVCIEARQFKILSGARNSMKTAKENVDAIVSKYRRSADRADKTAVSAILMGLEKQIESTISIVSGATAPFEFGISTVAGSTLLEPFAESVTEGLEALIGNVIGGSLDTASFPVASSLQRNVGILISLSQEYHINVSRLQLLQTLLQNSLTEAKS